MGDAAIGAAPQLGDGALLSPLVDKLTGSGVKRSSQKGDVVAAVTSLRDDPLVGFVRRALVTARGRVAGAPLPGVTVIPRVQGLIRSDRLIKVATSRRAAVVECEVRASARVP